MIPQLKKTMKKNIVISLITIICCVAVSYAQNDDTYTAEMLEGKDWYVKFIDEEQRERDSQGIRLENNQFVSFFYSNNRRKEVVAPYYLSPTQDKTFIPSKIGLYKSGSYIISQDRYGFTCAKILSLTNDTLIIYCDWNRSQLTFTTQRTKQIH